MRKPRRQDQTGVPRTGDDHPLRCLGRDIVASVSNGYAIKDVPRQVQCVLRECLVIASGAAHNARSAPKHIAAVLTNNTEPTNKTPSASSPKAAQKSMTVRCRQLYRREKPPFKPYWTSHCP